MKKKWNLGTIVMMLFAMGCSSGGDGIGGGDITRFRAALDEAGFQVQDGKMLPLDIPDLFCRKVLPSCYGNNNDTPYMVYVLPPAPDQDPAVQNTFPWTYRMRPDEAVVFIGKTPPPVKYFSYKTYLAGYLVEGEPVIRRIYASLGDTVNNFRINTAGGNDPFEKLIILIAAADRGVEARVRAAAEQAGYGPETMNTDVIPSTLLNLGLGLMDDELTFIHRLAFFEDAAEQAAYMNPEPVIVDGKLIGPPYEPNDRGFVLRLTPKPGREQALQPYSVPSLIVRGRGTTELDRIDALEDLREALLTRHDHLNAAEYESHVWLTEGYDAIQRGIDVLGETRDTIYLRTDAMELGDGPDEFLMVYGLIHALTGKATYSNLNIYTEDPVTDLLPLEKAINFGFMSVNSEKSAESREGMKGSADAYLPGHPDAPILYAWKISRNCMPGEDYCLQIPESQCERLTFNKLFAAFRGYVEPGTLVGPTASELLYDRVIHFTPK